VVARRPDSPYSATDNTKDVRHGRYRFTPPFVLSES
jgi:hypothetical protein